MAVPGLVAASNLADAENKKTVWDNLGAGVDAAIPTTNLLTRSQEFETSPPWLPVRLTVASNAIEAPNGTFTADKIEEISTISSSLIYQNHDSINGTMVLSVFCKRAERTQVYFSFSNFIDESSYGFFDLTNGSTFTFGGGLDYTNLNSSTVAFDDGWYRCIFKATKNNIFASNKLIIQIQRDTVSGVPGNGLYVWGAQLELAEEAGPYVPTAAAIASASPTASIVIQGNDILELTGARLAAASDFVKIKGLTTFAQPRLTAAAVNAASGAFLRDHALLKASPFSEGDYFLSRGALDGQSLRVNDLGIASLSGTPFSGDTASCPLLISSFAAPTNLRINDAMASGTLAFPEKAIPIETDQFIFYAKAGQS